MTVLVEAIPDMALNFTFVMLYVYAGTRRFLCGVTYASLNADFYPLSYVFLGKFKCSINVFHLSTPFIADYYLKGLADFGKVK